MPKCPVLIDVQTEDDFAADPRLIPGAIRRPWSQASEWAKEFTVLFGVGPDADRHDNPLMLQDEAGSIFLAYSQRARSVVTGC